MGFRGRLKSGKRRGFRLGREFSYFIGGWCEALGGKRGREVSLEVVSNRGEEGVSREMGRRGFIK